jgi:hypothetical protein
MSALAAQLPTDPQVEREEKRQETWEKFRAARQRWWGKPTAVNFRAYKTAERRFLDAWGTDDAL